MTGTIIGLPVSGVGGSALDPTRNIGYRSVNDHLDVLNMARFLKVGELPLGTSASNAGSFNRIGRMSISADGSVLAVITNAGFSIVRPLLESPKNTNLVRNGVFDAATTHWQTFALPDPTYIDSNVSDGTFRFNKLPPPAGQPSQAVVFQQTGMALPAGAPLQARFDLGTAAPPGSGSACCSSRQTSVTSASARSGFRQVRRWLPTACARTRRNPGPTRRSISMRRRRAATAGSI
jgi:hypothetical protein